MLLNISKFKRQTYLGEQNRVQWRRTPSNLINSIYSQQNLVRWQSSTGQEQKNGAQSSMAYVKQEPVDQGNEQQYKSHLSSPRGLSSFSPSQAHGNAMTGTLKDDALEMQSARMGFSGVTSTVTSNTASSSMTAQLEPNNSVILT